MGSFKNNHKSICKWRRTQKNKIKNDIILFQYISNKSLYIILYLNDHVAFIQFNFYLLLLFYYKYILDQTGDLLERNKSVITGDKW